MLIIRKILKFNIIIYFFGISLSLLGCATINIGPSLGDLNEITIEGAGPDKILLVDIDGIINNRKDRTLTGNTIHLGMVEQVRSVIEKAEKDKSIKALLVKINSPGGTVTASDIIFNLFKEYKERNKVKIYVQVMDLAASGGYYIAISGDEIIAHPTSLIGSIGVIALKVNLKDLMTKIGVDWEIVKSGDKKDFMSPFRPFTKEERELFQTTIDKFHKRFVTNIVNNRKGLNLSQVKVLADGRIFDAQEAKKFNLIDHISYLNGTVKKIKTDLKNLDLKLITYHRNEKFQGNIYSKLENPNIFKMINPYLNLNPNSLSPYFLYIWAP